MIILEISIAYLKSAFTYFSGLSLFGDSISRLGLKELHSSSEYESLELFSDFSNLLSMMGFDDSVSSLMITSYMFYLAFALAPISLSRGLSDWLSFNGLKVALCSLISRAELKDFSKLLERVPNSILTAENMPLILSLKTDLICYVESKSIICLDYL